MDRFFVCRSWPNYVFESFEMETCGGEDARWVGEELDGTFWGFPGCLPTHSYCEKLSAVVAKISFCFYLLFVLKSCAEEMGLYWALPSCLRCPRNRSGRRRNVRILEYNLRLYRHLFRMICQNFPYLPWLSTVRHRSSNLLRCWRNCCCLLSRRLLVFLVAQVSEWGKYLKLGLHYR